MFYPMMLGGDISGGFASATATAAECTAREARMQVELLHHDIDRLLLITEALWTLMKQEHGYADQVLTKLIEEIELNRIKANGVAAKDPPQDCPACGKPNSAKRMFCMYCGKPILANPFAH